MITDLPTGKTERSLLEKLADQVQELYLRAQGALPADQAKLNALYREAFQAHRAHKIFMAEQDALLLKTMR